MATLQLPLNPWTPEQYRTKTEELCDLLMRLQRIKNDKRDAMKSFADSINEIEVGIAFIAGQIKEQGGIVVDEETGELQEDNRKSIRDFTKRK